MSGPLLVAVDDPARLRDVERELRNRYEPDYRVRHGSVKRVASAVGEDSIAVQLVHRLLAA